MLITGAASGIGRACAFELARRGAQLALADIDKAGLEQISGVLGQRASTWVADLASPAEIDHLAQSVLQNFGHIDVLINNAGVAVVAPLEDTTEADWDWIFAVNVRAPIRLTRALLPHMFERGKGHIVLTASLAGLTGAPGMLAYATTKSALVGFAKSLRLDVASKGIDVTTVCPGYVRTNLHRNTRYANDGFKKFLDDPPAWYGVTQELAAVEIAGAIERKDPLLVFGLEKLGWWLERVSPAASFALAKWAGRRAGILG